MNHSAAGYAILHIEDSALDAELVQERLARAGLSLTIERVSQRDAIEARLQRKRYDLILSDYELPNVDGPSALALAQIHQPNTPFIFISGVMGEELAIETLKRGATDYVLKHSMSRLVTVIERALADARQHAEHQAATAALRESEQRLRALVEATTQMLWTATPDGRAVADSPSWRAFTGQTEAARQGFGWLAAIHPDDRTRVENEWRAAILNKTICELKYRLRRADGEYSWTIARAVPVCNEAGAVQEWMCANTDITSEQRAVTALKKSEERYARTARGANDGLWEWNLDSGAVYFSPRWKNQLGYTDEQIGSAASEWLKRVHPDDAAKLINVLDEKKPAFEIEHRLQHKAGHYRWMLARGVRAIDADGNVYLAGSQTDIQARKQAEIKLAHDMLHDALTGLPNRTLFLDRLSQALRLTQRYAARTFAVLYIDLDRFKLVNDSLGHALGDALLRQIAQRLKHQVRESDTLARLAGDEFVLLLENIHDREEALQKAKLLEHTLGQPFHIERQELHTSASIGIVLGANFYNQAEDVLRDADNAMYAAKKNGRSRAVFFNQSMREDALRRVRLVAELKHALKHGLILPYFQPIVCLKSERILGFEALARWRHPSNGIGLPPDLIPVAEETGLILPLGETILAQACAQLARWRRLSKSELTISVNLSARQLGQSDLVTRISALLKENGLPGAALKLEITESTLIESLVHERVLEDIRALGIGLIMDDFGTGYSALHYLHRLPFDALKVDRSFVGRLPDNTKSVEIVGTISSLARSLSLDAIPEGVETLAQRSKLAAMGFRAAQGFYFARPMSAQQAGELLKNQRRRHTSALA